MKILLAKRRALGDTILLSSTIDLVRAALPNAEISALVPESFRPVLEGHPGLKNLWGYEQGFFFLMKNLRKENLDYFLQLHASPRTTPLAYFTAKNFLAHRQNTITEKAYGRHPNALEWDALFLHSIWQDIPQRASSPKIYLSDLEKKIGADFWRAHGVTGEKVAILGLGASRITKRWPAKHFAKLAELMRDRLDLVPVVVTGPGEEEAEFSARVLDEMRALGFRSRVGNKGDFLHLAGVPLRKLAQLFSAAKFYVGNDSGPKHLALAVGVPTFTFFGPEDPVEWHPYSRTEHPVFFQEGLNCRAEDKGRWCGIPICEVEKHRCMVDLDPLDAFARIQKFFEERK